MKNRKIALAFLLSIVATSALAGAFGSEDGAGGPPPDFMPPGSMPFPKGGPGPGVGFPNGPHGLKSAGITPAVADIAYGTRSATQKLDVYLPQKGNAPFPVVIYAHPGGFRFGDKDMVSGELVKTLLDEGFAFVSVNY